MKYPLLLLFLGAWLVYSPVYAQDTDLQSLRRQAEQGNAGAQTELGYLYHTGDGVERDYAEAVKWYRQAAEQGHPDAQYNLGVAYAFGEGVERDLMQASNWYRRAAEQGHAVAAFSLGLSYLYGDGVQQNSRQAAQWFRQSAEQGYTRAQVHLGSLHHTGEGIPQDYEVAAYWYRQAAERGDATAQYNLGNLYRAGRGVPKDNKAALHWFRMAADQGYALAQAEVETFRQPAPVTANTSPAGEQQIAATEPAAGPPARRVVSPPLESEQSMELEPVTAEPRLKQTEATVPAEDMTDDETAVTAPETGTVADTAEEPATTNIATEPEVTGFADMSAADHERTPRTPPDADAAETTAAETGATTSEDSARKNDAAIGGFFGRLFGREPAADTGSDDQQVATTTNDPDAATQAPRQATEPGSVATAATDSEQDATNDVPTNEEWREPVTDNAGTDGAGVNASTSTAKQPKEQVQADDPAAASETVALNEPQTLDKEESGSGDVSISAAAQAALDADNYPEALRLLQTQALNGNAAAETMLGDMYFQGRGVEQNHDRALLWYRRAAKRNYADAQFNLGNMYLLGEGVLQDDLKARDWYQKAADQGHADAARNLANIKRRIADKKRYHPDNHGGPTRRELETAVEQQPATSETPSDNNSTTTRRVVSPPIEPPTESTGETGTAASQPDKPDTETTTDRNESPESRRIVSPPIEPTPE